MQHLFVFLWLEDSGRLGSTAQRYTWVILARARGAECKTLVVKLGREVGCQIWYSCATYAVSQYRAFHA